MVYSWSIPVISVFCERSHDARNVVSNEQELGLGVTYNEIVYRISYGEI